MTQALDVAADPKTVAFGVRLEAAVVARLDTYAASHTHKRGWALARAVAAGLDVLEGVPNQPPIAREGPSDLRAVVAEVVRAELAPVLEALRTRADASKGPPAPDPRQIPLLPSVVAAVAPAPPRIDPATLRAVVPSAQRRKGPPERRDPAPRESAPGRRLADALKAAREARGLTQKMAADNAGVSIATYQRAEQGNAVGLETAARFDAWIARDLVGELRAWIDALPKGDDKPQPATHLNLPPAELKAMLEGRRAAVSPATLAGVTEAMDRVRQIAAERAR